jgi:hypothetical protein
MRCEQVRPGCGRRRVHAVDQIVEHWMLVDDSAKHLGWIPSGARTTGAPRRAPSGAGDHERCCRAVSGAQPAARPATLLTDRLRKISRLLEDGHFQRPDGRATRSVPPSTSVHAVTQHLLRRAGGDEARSCVPRPEWLGPHPAHLRLPFEPGCAGGPGWVIDPFRARQHRAGNDPAAARTTTVPNS